ncbi:HET-domain-containing protein [Mollisia scopiformis]|uniref:HET-domain-containing protein n=1 Tax=Mollisia scopiformis TaxID=149040 RepID=A0A132B5C7_MOLSC|nr:HET-domain-containing protein [Mollisia scopiformis]KUJ07615.1 HET-domain-containing protein [Mollisia scopiformis]
MAELSYRPLTTKQFRLLTLLPGAEASPIQTTLRHVNLEDKPKFDALSYEWGPESTHNSEVFVDKKPFTIRHNLWLFLKRLRATSQSAQVIYADAICINQKDNEEKGHQVALMSEIYMRAKTVLVWIGEHDPSSELVFGTHFEDKIPRATMKIPFVNLLAVPVIVAGRVRRATSASSAERIAAWTAVLSRSYWNRTWIVQEFLLARSVVVFCGEDHMDRDLIFTKPLQDHFMRMMQKKKGKLEGIPRSFLLYFWKLNQKRHGIFSKGTPYFANIDIFELAFNFQYTECQVMLDHVYGLLALEDVRKSVPITPRYGISGQILFIDICMLKLPRVTGNNSKVTDDGVWRVPKLFRGLRLTFDHAEEILDILFDNSQYKTQNNTVIATIFKGFDHFGLLKPERKQWILPQTKAFQTTDQIISVTRQWRATQKNNGKWYDLQHTAQIHEPPGLSYLQLDEPLWSHYTTLRDTTAAAAANARNAQNMNQQNINQMNQMNQMNLNTMNMMIVNNINNMNTTGMMGPGGGGGA